jgi:hypothetical protein
VEETLAEGSYLGGVYGGGLEGEGVIATLKHLA